MTIQLRDSFESGASATALMWHPTGFSTVTSGGRWGAGCLDTSGGNNNCYKVLKTARTKVGLHVAFYADNGMPQEISFMEDSGRRHVYLAVNGNNRLQFFNNVGTAIGAQGTTDIAIGVWCAIEAWVEISDASGVVKLWVNGAATPEISESSKDTQNGGSGTVGNIYIRTANGTNQHTYFNDFVVYDDQGSYNNTAPLGDVRVSNLIASGNGASSQFVGSDADSTDNYQLVDDVPPDDDTSYVESSTVTDKDTYAMTDLATTSGTILAVGANLYARKTDAGTRSLKPVYRLAGGTEADGSEVFLGSSYQAWEDVAETKPGGGAWSISDVNGMQVGQKVTA